MSATDTLVEAPRTAAAEIRESVLLASLAISSFAALLLELALT